MRVWVSLLVVAVLVGGCQGNDQGDRVASTTAPEAPPPSEADPMAWLRPTLPGVGDAEQLDWSDFRPLVGSWELVSLSTADVGPRTISFNYQRSDETSLSYRVSWSRRCWGGHGFYAVSGDRISIAVNGVRTLVITECDTDADLAARERALEVFLAGAELFSISGRQLTIIDSEGEEAVFDRAADPRPVDSDELSTVVPRLHFVDESGFMVLLQEQEDSDGVHAAEQVNWVAWMVGSVDVGWQTASVASPNSWTFRDRRVPDAFVAVEFDLSPERTCLVADMNTLHGDNPASLRYRSTMAGVELLVDEEESTSIETGHTDELIRAVVVDCVDEPISFQGLEVGRVEQLTGDWQTVTLVGSFDDPVVVAGPASLNGRDPGVVEVRNVTPESFEIRFHEWDYLDGFHPTGETVSYVVAERGTTTLPSGAWVEAGTTDASSVIRAVEFADPFDAPPVLISTVAR